MNEVFIGMTNAAHPAPGVLHDKDMPAWFHRAMDLFADHSLPNDEFDLRGQYAENRMFLRRIETDRHNGVLGIEELRELEEAFAKACALPEGDPMLALEEVYLQQYYKRQPAKRRAAAPAVSSAL